MNGRLSRIIALISFKISWLEYSKESCQEFIMIRQSVIATFFAFAGSLMVGTACKPRNEMQVDGQSVLHSSSASGPRIYFDMDGVIADWDQAFVKAFNLDPKLVSQDVKVAQMTAAGDRFWLDSMPLMAEGHKVWLAMATYQRAFLTSCLDPEIAGCRSGKRKWLDKYIQTDFQMLVYHEKADVRERFNCFKDGASCFRHGDVLIDDNEKLNSKSWTEAGGCFVRHVTAEGTFKQLREKCRVSPMSDSSIQDVDE
jgi:hypothetical protein